MATAHIESDLNSIASIVIMPGDPLRAKFIAEHYLEGAILVNDVRNCFGYTGTYKGKRLTVFASGMGISSMGIYAYELFTEYNVESIIRVGSCGSYKEDLELFDLVLVANSVSDSNFGKAFSGDDSLEQKSSHILNEKIINAAQIQNKHITIGNIYCSEAFYHLNSKESSLIKSYGCVGVEMETFALFHIANKLGKNASALLTVSDSFITKEETTSEEREKGFTDMIEVVLDSLHF